MSENEQRARSIDRVKRKYKPDFDDSIEEERKEKEETDVTIQNDEKRRKSKPDVNADIKVSHFKSISQVIKVVLFPGFHARFCGQQLVTRDLWPNVLAHLTVCRSGFSLLRVKNETFESVFFVNARSKTNVKTETKRTIVRKGGEDGLCS